MLFIFFIVVTVLMALVVYPVCFAAVLDEGIDLYYLLCFL